jgi:hypothetical protein
MQEYQVAVKVLSQLVCDYSKPKTRCLASAGAALETMGHAFFLMGDFKSAQSTLEECLSMAELMRLEQPTRQPIEAENAKVFFLLALVYERLGQPERVCWCWLLPLFGSPLTSNSFV